MYLYAALIREWLLFPLTHDPCGDYLRAATIQSAAFIRGNMEYAVVVCMCTSCVASNKGHVVKPLIITSTA